MSNLTRVSEKHLHQVHQNNLKVFEAKQEN